MIFTHGNASASTATGDRSAASGDVSSAYGVLIAASGAGAAAYGASSTASGVVSAAFGALATASGSSSVAIGSNATATAANSVALGAGSVANQANTVSVGAPGNERRITNVAAGIAPTDAVNVSQLSSIATGFQSQINSLQNQIDDNRREARGGTALALAATGLRYDDRPGKASLAAALAHFRGETGLAIGLGYNYGTQLRFNGAVTGAPNSGYYGVSAGAAWR